MRRAAFALGLGLAVAAGCGASVDIVDVDASSGGPDGAAGADAPSVADAAPPDAAPCTGGTTNATDGTTCYEAFLALPLPWDAAQTVCLGRGGALAKIEGLPENQVIATLVGSNRAWIGGKDLVEGTFQWTDATPFIFTNWRTGEPNNGSGNFEEDCALIEGQNGGTWDDRPCDDNVPNATVPGQYLYVCERLL